jgi:hypothetical protein
VSHIKVPGLYKSPSIIGIQNFGLLTIGRTYDAGSDVFRILYARLFGGVHLNAEICWWQHDRFRLPGDSCRTESHICGCRPRPAVLITFHLFVNSRAFLAQAIRESFWVAGSGKLKFPRVGLCHTVAASYPTHCRSMGVLCQRNGLLAYTAWHRRNTGKILWTQRLSEVHNTRLGFLYESPCRYIVKWNNSALTGRDFHYIL